MTLSAILILISIGLVLILIEFLVLPGTNIAGIIGILMIIAGIYYGYKDIGPPVAHYILIGSFLFMMGAIWYVLRSDTWKKISLNSTISSKVETIKEQSVKPGDLGKTITRLAPVGKVLVNDIQFEARSGHSFLDPETPIEVVKINGNQLIVKPTE